MLQTPLRRALEALTQQRFFKLIVGASLTDIETMVFLTRVYALAGAHCVDIAAHLEALPAMAGLQAEIEAQGQAFPLGMVSVSLDPDPHFRKISLSGPTCISCGACLPVCPTEALAWNPAYPAQGDANPLLIHQPLCYGCNRCVPVCPTEALTLHPHLDQAALEDVLRHPWVQAVELHTQWADVDVLQAFLGRYAQGLRGKLWSICFRPSGMRPEAWLAYVQTLSEAARQHSAGPLIFQVDGQPMSGRADDPETSRPAVEAAWEVLNQGAASWAHVTVSGGINAHTGNYLRRAPGICGVGVGSVAREVVWPFRHGVAADTRQAVDTARHLMWACLYSTS
jgi:ferredoxin